MSEQAIAVAWLHDVIEDTGLTAEDLRAGGMPEAVVSGVLRLTSPLKDASKSRFERKWEQFEKLRSASEIIRTLKLLDREHNLSQVGALSKSFQRLYAMESIWLLDVLGVRQLGDNVRALAKAILAESWVVKCG